MDAKTQKNGWQTTETIFIFLICDFALSKQGLTNIKPLCIRHVTYAHFLLPLLSQVAGGFPRQFNIC